MKKLAIVLLAGFALSGFAPTKQLCKGIFPKNNKWIPVSRDAEGISEAAFNGVLDKIVAVYNPIVASHGYTLDFERMWDDGTVNSDTYTSGGQWIIDAYGGLARYKGMTTDGYAAVACHELGHHLGGAPQFEYQNEMSVEGEADYHVGTKCLRKVFAADDNVKIMSGVKVDAGVVAACTASFPGNAQQIALCERAAVASFVVADILRDLEGDPAIAFNTPDPSVVRETNEDHPAAQCRLDTYYASAICTVSSDIELSSTDYKVGACASGTGSRPLCWFKPD